jgi:hypothetical protein
MVDRRQALEALRDRLAAAADEADDRDLPALSRELRMVWQALDELPATGAKASAPDQIAQRREERRRKAAGA